MFARFTDDNIGLFRFTGSNAQVCGQLIKGRDAAGTVDAAAFMRFKQELWNEDRTRLTVLIDPGRIKREVATNVELGPALLSGRRYRLEVAAGWPAADGASALPSFSKTFDVSTSLRSLPDTKLWSTTPVCAGTRNPLTVTFDRHLLARFISLQTGEGDPIAGEIDVAEAERVWRFTPASAWSAGDVRLIVDRTLEDAAGNNFRDLLDHVAEQQNEDWASSELQTGVAKCDG